MVLPEVVGVKLTNSLPKGVMASDLGVHCSCLCGVWVKHIDVVSRAVVVLGDDLVVVCVKHVHLWWSRQNGAESGFEILFLPAVPTKTRLESRFCNK